MKMDERRPIQAVGAAVDPWEGHPLFPDYERYQGLMVMTEQQGPMVIPVVPGYAVGRHRAQMPRTLSARIA